jgi:hypothetical protein
MWYNSSLKNNKAGNMMSEMEVRGEPPVDELLNDPIMKMWLDTTGNMPLETLRPWLEETAERLFRDVA